MAAAQAPTDDREGAGRFYVLVPLVQALAGLAALVAAVGAPFWVDLPLGFDGGLSLFYSIATLVVLAALGFTAILLFASAYMLVSKRETALELASRAQRGYAFVHFLAFPELPGAEMSLLLAVVASATVAVLAWWWVQREKSRAEDLGFAVGEHMGPIAFRS